MSDPELHCAICDVPNSQTTLHRHGDFWLCAVDESNADECFCDPTTAMILDAARMSSVVEPGEGR